jgi:hypothetical protein
VIATFSAAPLGVAQTCTSGKLSVRVQDASEKPIPGAQVRIAMNASLNASSAVVRRTDAGGIAEFESLRCGAGVISAAKDGFQELSAAPFDLTRGANTQLDLTLSSLVVHDSVEVHATAPSLEQTSSSQAQELRADDVKNLPLRPVTVTDALPLVPGVVRVPDGEIHIDGAGEHRSAFVVNQADVTDPATGRFGQTIPIDSVETADVLSTPFLAEFGHFTSGVVTVQTRRGGESWHAELNDPLPEFRFRSWHMRGLRDATPRILSSGPVIKDRLYFSSAIQYSMHKIPERTLPFPFNESKQESINSLTQFDYIVSAKQVVTGTFHFSPQHVNFVNPEYFNPQAVTPSSAQHNYVATLGDRLGVGGGTLDSTLSIQRFDAAVGSQGSADMILTPIGNRGNYFSTQRREAGRVQWLEMWSPGQLHLGKTGAGTHLLKFGTSVTQLSNSGQLTERPIEMLDTAGLLLRRIAFTGGSPYDVTDNEVAVFAQDQWALTPKLAVDLGGRIERQNIAGSVRLAPRTGVSWSPFAGGRTVFRAGYGIFYDRVPLGVYAFRSNPHRVVTDYAPDGSALGDPLNLTNVLGAGSGSWLSQARHKPGNFTPRSDAWNLQVEQRVMPFFRVRANYTSSHSAGLVTLEPQAVEASSLMLMGGGRSAYRQFSITGRLEGKKGQQLFLAYTRSRAQGTLNEFSSYLGNFPLPLIRRNVFSNLRGDVPNRFLAWGTVSLPGDLQLLPILEYRTGFPYAVVDALGDYVGTPNSDRTRFPNYLAADARILKDIKVNAKYTLRFSVSGFNLTNHFNALSVHSNVADPYYGTFFGNYHLRYRADFDVLF